jgi:Rieske Fe-S protein
MDPSGPARVPRRDVLALLGTGGAVVATGGLSALLAACSAQGPTTVTLSIDPASLTPGQPVEVPFSIQSGGQAVAGSTWLVKAPSGELVAFDPRCTHARCAYAWDDASAQFACHCHPGLFRVDGSVISGPPPRPLDRFPARVVGNTVQVDVPAGFTTPRASD